ncbi:MAG: RNA methyltransferase [Chloroflexota bacterium]
MSPELITSRGNPLVKQARALRQRKARQESGLFLVEGIHHVGEAVEAGWDVEAILYAPERLTSDFALRLVDEQSRRGVRCQPLSAEVFDSLAEKDNPQGLVALVRQRAWTLRPAYPSGAAQGDALSLLPLNFRFGAALVSPQDPGNLGAILRTIDAAGADGLFVLDGGVDIYHPSCIRASMGTIFSTPLAQAGFDEFVTWARGKNLRLVGASAKASADYRTLDVSQPSVLVLGSEQKGLTPEQVAACDVTVSLPMRGRASSLNLAVAAGILLYALGDMSGNFPRNTGSV